MATFGRNGLRVSEPQATVSMLQVSQYFTSLSRQKPETQTKNPQPSTLHPETQIKQPKNPKPQKPTALQPYPMPFHAERPQHLQLKQRFSGPAFEL